MPLPHETHVDEPFRFVPRVFELTSVPSSEALARALPRLGSPAFLDSAGGAPRHASVLAFDPLPWDRSMHLGDLPMHLGAVATALDRLQVAGGDRVPGPFAGGFLGAISYDLGVAGEALDLPRDPWSAPPLVGGLYIDFVVIDHAAGRAWLVLGDEPGDGRPPVAERRAACLAWLSDPGPAALEPTPAGPLVRHVPGDVHRARIESLRDRIARGELYQANLAHRFTRAIDGHPAAIYTRLRTINPAPYMAYLAWDGGALLSASPELLLAYDGERAHTRPIKGTVARGRDPVTDAAARARLLTSEKDRAELAMIVDLERNDLGRIATRGGVRTSAFPTLETYATVHHLVADVSARPREGIDAFGVLEAVFPGGSITGAPKLAAMEAIGELEGEGRGFFTGALGFVDLRGRARFNILIRTLRWRPRPGSSSGSPSAPAGEVSFHVGGGITWASDAHAEELETLAKGRALARTIAGEGEGEGPFAELDGVRHLTGPSRMQPPARP
ncbi:MAG: anthranilate synthase component I family protein [bacterium]|nr:anthranilate synthase component I family protein [bacterium]